MTRRRVVPPIPEHMRVPGYFTELMRRHNWPPMFEPQPVDRQVSEAKSRGATEARERQAAQGIGWAGGTCVMPGTPGHLRPAWMVRSKVKA